MFVLNRGDETSVTTLKLLEEGRIGYILTGVERPRPRPPERGGAIGPDRHRGRGRGRLRELRRVPAPDDAAAARGRRQEGDARGLRRLRQERRRARLRRRAQARRGNPAGKSNCVSYNSICLLVFCLQAISPL